MLLPVTGCASKPKVPEAVKFTHPKHGKIAYTDQRFQAERDRCERDVYKQGVVINGKTVTDPDVAMRALSNRLTTQAKRGFQHVTKPAYMTRLNELDKLTDECMVKKGWKKQPIKRKRLSASSRRSLLKLHQQGKIKLSPERVKEMKKDLWFY